MVKKQSIKADFRFNLLQKVSEEVVTGMTGWF
jgi:hypothetical protein